MQGFGCIGSVGHVIETDFIVNMKKELEGRAQIHFDLLKDLSGCWTESQYKGEQLGGSCDSPGTVA